MTPEFDWSAPLNRQWNEIGHLFLTIFTTSINFRLRVLSNFGEKYGQANTRVARDTEETRMVKFPRRQSRVNYKVISVAKKSHNPDLCWIFTYMVENLR